MLYIIQAIDECWFIIKIILTFYLYIILCKYYLIAFMAGNCPFRFGKGKNNM